MAIESEANWVGGRVGKYRIIRVLGQGGMGEVYLAQDTSLEREVALKRLLPVFAEDREFVARFKREARALSRTAHPGVVGIHSMDEIDGVLVIDLEYVSGPSLTKLLRDGVLTPQFLAPMTRTLLDALAVCHDEGIVHRDIKPSNILFTATMQAKLADFGIATALADSTATQLREGRSTTVVLGTPRFMPPEAWNGGRVTPQWDLFSLGVVLYECLTGDPAFRGATTGALAKQITNDPLPPISSRVSGLSTQLRELVDRLVQIDPAARCRSAAEALDILEGAPGLEGNPAGATLRRPLPSALRRGISKVRRSIRAARSRPSLTAGVAMMIVSVGLLTAAVVTGAPLRGARQASEGPTQPPIAATTSAGVPHDLIYDARPVSGEEGDHWKWWIRPDDDGGNSTVLGYSDRSILHATMRNSANSFDIAGEWAGFESPIGRSFQYGPVIGNGTRMREGEAFAIKLSFRSTIHRLSHEVSFVVEPDKVLTTSREFIAGLEEMQLPQTLIYDEMMPRRLALARTFDSLLPSVHGQRVRLPLDVETTPPIVDGRLDDPLWTRDYYDASGRVGELRDSNNPRAIAKFRVGPDGVYFAASVPRATDARLTASLGIVLGVGPPPQHAPRAVIDVAADGSTVKHYYEVTRELPFPDTWWIATSVADSAWELEGYVPLTYENPINLAMRPPWRFTLVVRDSDAKEAEPIAHWGASDMNSLIHGALLDFGAAQQ